MLVSTFAALILSAPQVPYPAPALDLRNLQGQVVRVKDWPVDRPVLVEFWATWCATCKRMEPRLRELYRSRTPNTWDMVSVSIDEDLAKLREEHRRSPKPWPVLMDTQMLAARRWGVKSVPAFFVVKGGQVVDQWVGDAPNARMLKLLVPAR